MHAIKASLGVSPHSQSPLCKGTLPELLPSRILPRTQEKAQHASAGESVYSYTRFKCVRHLKPKCALIKQHMINFSVSKKIFTNANINKMRRQTKSLIFSWKTFLQTDIISFLQLKMTPKLHKDCIGIYFTFYILAWIAKRVFYMEFAFLIWNF